MTVTSLRSPATTLWLARIFAANGSGIAGVNGADASGAAATATFGVGTASFPGAGVPHSGQKRNPGSMALPQLVHASGARAPQA